MFENYHAVKLQNFYKRFVKIERDETEYYLIKRKIPYQTKKGVLKTKTLSNKVFKPIDPLYRIPFNEKNVIRLIEYNKKYAVFYFNIITLIKWLNQCKKWINPLTNCAFLNSSREKIIKYCETHKTPNLRLKYSRNKNEKEKLSQENFQQEIITHINNKDIYRIGKLMSKYLVEIQSKNITLDFKVESNIYNELTKEYLTSIHLIHYVILKGNYTIFSILFNYFEDLDCLTYPGYYTPLHLTAFNNQKYIASKLKDGGCEINATCQFQEKDEVSIFELCDILGNNEFIKYLFDN